MTKKERDGEHPSSHYLVVEDPEHPPTWHLRVRDASGALNHTLMGAAWAALHGGYRGNKYEGPGKQAALAKLKVLYKSEGMDLPSDTSSDGSQPSPLGRGGTRSGGWVRGSALVFSHLLRVQLDEPVLVAGKSLFPLTVCVTGTWVKNGHEFSITAQDLAAMARNFEKRKNEQVVIDYEHASEQPEVAKGGPVPAAGWIHELQVENGNSKMENGKPVSPPITMAGQFPVSLGALVEWTPLARDLIAGGQYRFFSPAIDWGYADKETGEPQGATLTSGALTNHPFLEELPAIALSDADLSDKAEGKWNADTSTGYLDAPLTTPSVGCQQGGATDPPIRTAGPANKDGGNRQEEWRDKRQGAKMAKSKKLSIKKMTDDDFEGAQGHHGIFDGDDFVGHVHADDMKDHVKSCIEDGFGGLDDLSAKAAEGKGQAGVKGHQTKDGTGEGVDTMTELLRECGVRSEEAGETPEEQVRKALKFVATQQTIELAEQGRKALLTEAVKDGVLLSDKAQELARANRITLNDYIAAQEAAQMLERAVQAGKILPRDRAFFFIDAFERPAEFSAWCEKAGPVIQFGSAGIGSAEQLPVDQEVDLEVKKLMSEKKLSYSKAMKELFRASPQLEERYRAAHRQEVKGDSVAAAREGGITQ